MSEYLTVKVPIIHGLSFGVYVVHKLQAISYAHVREFGRMLALRNLDGSWEYAHPSREGDAIGFHYIPPRLVVELETMPLWTEPRNAELEGDTPP